MNADTAPPRRARRRSARGIRIAIAVFVLACLAGIAWLVPRLLEATFELEVDERIEEVQAPAPLSDPEEGPVDLSGRERAERDTERTEPTTLDDTLVELLRLPPPPPEPAPPTPASD